MCFVHKNVPPKRRKHPDAEKPWRRGRVATGERATKPPGERNPVNDPRRRRFPKTVLPRIILSATRLRGDQASPLSARGTAHTQRERGDARYGFGARRHCGSSLPLRVWQCGRRQITHPRQTRIGNPPPSSSSCGCRGVPSPRRQGSDVGETQRKRRDGRDGTTAPRDAAESVAAPFARAGPPPSSRDDRGRT